MVGGRGHNSLLPAQQDSIKSWQNIARQISVRYICAGAKQHAKPHCNVRPSCPDDAFAS